MRLLLVTKDLTDNSTGRTYVLWLLARELGWAVTVAAPAGSHVWGPVASGDFLHDCQTIPPGSARWDALVCASDLVIAVKPLMESFGLAERLSRRHSTPLLVDIDDPDIEAVLSEGDLFKSTAKAILQPRRYWGTRAIRRRVAKYPHLVSTPTLQLRYGGTIVPHARADSGIGTRHTTHGPRVVFVGTNRPHKGVQILRDAVAQVAHEGVTLTITDVPPNDAQTWELWTGPTTLENGIDIVKAGDIVVIPSLGGEAYARAQLPVKIIDGMLAARPIVVSNLDPLTWAAGEGGRVCAPGSATSLAAALRELCDPEVRTRLGEKARARALAMFTVEAVAPAFESACLAAMDGHKRA